MDPLVRDDIARTSFVRTSAAFAQWPLRPQSLSEPTVQTAARAWHDSATLFEVGFTSTGQEACLLWGNYHPVSGQFDDFQIGNTDGDAHWTAHWNGDASMPGNNMVLDIRTGANLLGGERGITADSGYIHGVGMEEWQDFNGAWTYWDDLEPWTDLHPVDTCYRMNRVNAHEGEAVFKSNPLGCP
jgi:hypothetical protein